jgi:hypothetical protein
LALAPDAAHVGVVERLVEAVPQRQKTGVEDRVQNAVSQEA